jgi:hypothetical protein
MRRLIGTVARKLGHLSAPPPCAALSDTTNSQFDHFASETRKRSVVPLSVPKLPLACVFSLEPNQDG